MEILSILAGLKDKVLDAAHYELLRGAYELQSKNIEQLQINNDALKERGRSRESFDNWLGRSIARHRPSLGWPATSGCGA